MNKYLKVLIGIIILVGICLINFLGIKFYSEYRINLIDVVVSSHNISGRHLISEEDIAYIQIPYEYVNDKAYINKEDIIGKYTDIQGKIPVGSLFYKSMIFDEKDLPDNPVSQLKKNQTLFTMQADVLSLSGNVIVPGHRVDLYGSINKQDNFIEDLLVSNVRVVSIKDSKGYDLDHPSSNKMPYTISFAINNESLKILSMINKIGKIEIYPTSNSYSTTDEAKLNKSSKLIKYINNDE